jgi:hypothetical protein
VSGFLIVPDPMVGESSLWIAVPKSVADCGSPIAFVSKTGGWAFLGKTTCESFYCPTHGPEKIRERLKWAIDAFDSLERIWIGRGDADWVVGAGGDRRSRLSDRIRQRRKRADGDFVWVRRLNGSTIVFATHDLSGRKSPAQGHWMSPAKALVVLRPAMRFPGVDAVRFSERWEKERQKEKKESDLWPLGPMSERTWDLTCDLAAAQCEDEYGISPNVPGLAPFGVPPRAWLEIMKSAAAQAKAIVKESRDDSQ